MFKVSQSKVKCWRRCHKQYDYKYNQKLKKKVKKAPLFVGTMVHECLEAFFLCIKAGKNPSRRVKKILTEFRLQYKKLFDEERVELEGCVELAEGMVNRYMDFYKNDNDLKIIEVERQILVNLVDDIFLEGKIDIIWEDKRKRRMIGEHKTCKSIPDEEQRMSDIQTVIYWWALLKEDGVKYQGVIWDYLRKKLPAIPEPLKAGGLSKRKNIDTTYEVYLKAIKDSKEDPEDYEEILHDLKGRNNTFFRRITLPFNQDLVDNVVDDLISTAKQIKTLGKIVKDRNLSQDCSWCDYYSLCQTELRGLDSSFMRKKEFIIATDKPKGK